MRVDVKYMIDILAHESNASVILLDKVLMDAFESFVRDGDGVDLWDGEYKLKGRSIKYLWTTFVENEEEYEILLKKENYETRNE
jgi:hypothetical protein